MRMHEILDEESTKKDLTFYHGTDSGAFNAFDPDKAKKGLTYFNPLGQGMYASDSIRFAKRFGKNVHSVRIPAGATYKRITQRQWSQSVGRNIVLKSLKMAFDDRGEDLNAWMRGTATMPMYDLRQMGPGEIMGLYYEICAPKQKPATPRTSIDSDELVAMKKAIKASPKAREPRVEAKDVCAAFMVDLRKALDDNVPYKGLREAAELVDKHFDIMIAHAFQKAIPQVSIEVFSAYDFVIFTDTLDHGTGRDGKSAMEVLIINPALQRTKAMSQSDYISALAA